MAELVHRVLKSGIPKRLKPLTMVMANYAEKYGVRNIYPGIETLTADLGVTRSTVAAALAELVKRNILSVRTPGGGRARATKYQFNVTALPPPKPSGQSDGFHKPSKSAAETIRFQRVNHPISPPKPSGQSDPRRQKVLRRQKEKTDVPAAPRERAANDFVQTAFVQFQQIYPASRRVGGVQARRAFQSALNCRGGDSREAHLAKMLDALEQHTRSEQWQDPKHIPLMTKWLEQQRWITVLPEPHPLSEKGRATIANQKRLLDRMEG